MTGPIRRRLGKPLVSATINAATARRVSWKKLDEDSRVGHHEKPTRMIHCHIDILYQYFLQGPLLFKKNGHQIGLLIQGYTLRQQPPQTKY